MFQNLEHFLGLFRLSRYKGPILDARVELHEPRVRLAQTSNTTSLTRLNPFVPGFFFHCLSGHSLRQALFVYRLIVTTLIGTFLGIPS